ncbi:unnamed protein product [Somion occarium]|uniref:Uncharacterized protein n=1 Tax=Somion occarium TaxID=3059160 RepID=A0ABP1CI04_9APHY
MVLLPKIEGVVHTDAFTSIAKFVRAPPQRPSSSTQSSSVNLRERGLEDIVRKMNCRSKRAFECRMRWYGSLRPRKWQTFDV